jgi:hypothetical protein
MLIQKTAHDVQTKHGEGVRPMRIYVISPNVPDYPQAKFPGASAQSPYGDVMLKLEQAS